MQAGGMNELITAATYHWAWENQRLVVAVLNNRELNQVTWEMRAASGAPPFRPARDLPDVSMASFARTLGLTGIRVEKPEQVADGWREALAAHGPAVVEFLTDPAVPPLPPSAGWEELESATGPGGRPAAEADGRGRDRPGAEPARRGLRARLQDILPSGGGSGGSGSSGGGRG